MSDAALPPAPKVAPETLAIRTAPPRAIRFRRGVIITIAAVGSVSLMAAAWIALKPRVFSTVANHEELSEPTTRPSTDALNGLPATYGDAPRLGPPLPGDLGRPILEHQRAMATKAGLGTDPSVQAAAQERERQLAELNAARESGVLVQGRTASTPAAVPDATVTPTTPVAEMVPTPDPDRDPNRHDRKAQFAGALDRSGDINPHTLT
jgi:type IV secretion system protein TrbI